MTAPAMAARDHLGRLIVAMMQKNEGALLDSWFAHYRRLVPAENIFVIDNGSDDPGTIGRLAAIEREGANVVRRYAAHADFERKGRVIEEVVAGRFGQGDFLLPCDCDEFLYVRKPGGISVDPERIGRELGRLTRVEAPAFRVAVQHHNIPGSTLAFRGSMKKILLKDAIPHPIDTGHHYYDFRVQANRVAGMVETRFGFVHFHFKPFDALLRSARAKLSGRLPDFSEASLRAYKGPGRHLIPFFFMTEAEYAAQFQGRRNLVDLGDVFEGTGVVIPFADASPV